MNKQLTKEEAEEYYNKLWLENKELIQENIDKLNTKRFALEMELIDKDKDLERLHSIIKEVREYIEELLREEFEITDTDSVDYGTKCQRAYFSDSELIKVLEILDKENK